MITAETNADAMFCSCQSQFWEKNPIPPLEVHLIINSLSTGHLREVKNKGKFYKSGHGHLREVVTSKQFQMLWFDLKLLVFWKTGCWGEVVNQRFDCKLTISEYYYFNLELKMPKQVLLVPFCIALFVIFVLWNLHKLLL